MKKNVLIATAVIPERRILETLFAHLNEYELLPPVNSGIELLDTVLSQEVKVVILDLNLCGYDGIYVLDEIAKMDLQSRPCTFVVTSMSDDRLIDIVGQKCTYCFIRPIKYESVVMRVLEMTRKERIRRIENSDIDFLQAHISSCLRSLGISANLKGYHYLREAIRIVAMSAQPSKLRMMTDIYPAVAERFQTKVGSVERTMRFAIEVAWTRGNISMQHAYFGYTVNDKKGKPTSMEFITMVAERSRIYAPRKDM